MGPASTIAATSLVASKDTVFSETDLQSSSVFATVSFALPLMLAVIRSKSAEPHQGRRGTEEQCPDETRCLTSVHCATHGNIVSSPLKSPGGPENAQSPFGYRHREISFALLKIDKAFWMVNNLLYGIPRDRRYTNKVLSSTA